MAGREYQKIIDIDSGKIMMVFTVKYDADGTIKKETVINRHTGQLKGFKLLLATELEYKEHVKARKGVNTINSQFLIPGLSNPTKTKGIVSGK